MSKELQGEEEFEDGDEEISQLTQGDHELLESLIATYVQAECTREDTLNQIANIIKGLPENQHEEVLNEAKEIVRAVLRPIESQRLYGENDPLNKNNAMSKEERKRLK